MDRKETETILKTLFDFHKGNPPAEVVAHDLEISREEAEAAIQEYRQRYTPIVEKSLPVKKKVVAIKVSSGEKKKQDFSLTVIVAMMGLIGLGALAASYYYVYLRLIEILPFVLALILSSVLVLFAAFAPQIGVFLLLQKPEPSMGRPPKVGRKRGSSVLSKIVTSLILGVLWILVLVVNISSSIAGQYSTWTILTREALTSSEDLLVSNTHLEDYRNDKETLARTLELLLQEKNSLLQQLALYDTEEKQKQNQRGYNTLLYYITQNNKNIAAREEDLKRLSLSIEGLLKESPAVVIQRESSSILDFYVWLSEATGIAQETLHLYYLIFLAIFVELIAPVGVAIFLFLRNPAQKFKLGI